jgi:hypothetical protein
MRKKKYMVWMIGFLVVWFGWVEAKPPDFTTYHNPAEVNDLLIDFAASHPSIARLHKIAVSPGGSVVNVLELGPAIDIKGEKLPAVFVAANLEGTVPIATEAALYLAHLILDQPGTRQDKTWYILPLETRMRPGSISKSPWRWMPAMPVPIMTIWMIKRMKMA